MEEGYPVVLLDRTIKGVNGCTVTVDNIDGAYQAVNSTLKKKIPFTAVFASNDLMAFRAIGALQDNNLGVSEDISVIGYDDIVFCPSRILTTVAQPTYQLGKNAIVMLLDLIQGRIEAPQKVILRPSIVIRGTCILYRIKS